MNKIILGDALKELKKLSDNSIDCIITSPPYNMKGNILKSGHSAIVVNYNKYDDNLDNEDYFNWQINFLNECHRTLKQDGHLFYNHKPRYEKGKLIHPLTWIFKSKLYFYQEIIWKTNRRVDNAGYRFTPQTERIYWLKKSVNNLNKLSKSFITSDLWDLGRSERYNNHPAPFPLTLPYRILYSLYGEQRGKTILDPFAGSGTTLLASKILNHNYIGIEFDKKYIEQASKRLLDIDKAEIDSIAQEKLNYIVKKKYKKRGIRQMDLWEEVNNG